MTTRNLQALFEPRAIALIGASNQPGSVGAVVARNLFSGGFSGPIMPVHPRESEIQSVPAFNSVSALPQTPDLAVIATPARTVPGLIDELGAKGCRAVVVITAGLDASERKAMLEAARPRLMRIVGPNCLGFLSPLRGVNASFSHLAPSRGDIAFLTQSGAIATSIIDWAEGRGIGFSHILSLGDMSDVDFGDLLDYLALDSATKSILLYAESITEARKFMSAGRIAARAKPVVIVKAGRSSAGAQAAASHTGALAGVDAICDAAFRRAGMLRVETLRDLFDAAETLASGLSVRGERLMVLTNGGGLGVLAADALETHGGHLAKLSDKARATLDKALPAAWSRGNPVDILGDAHGDRYEAALDALGEEECDALLVMNCPTGVGDNIAAADAVLGRHGGATMPWLACWMGEATAQEARRRLSDGKLPNFETPDEAVRAFMHLAEYTRNQQALLETPAASAERPAEAYDTVRAIIDAVLAEGRDTLTEPEAKRVLAAYAIPTVETVITPTPEEAARAAAAFAQPVALKILSRQITHKSDVGGVKLGLTTPAEVEAAARAMLEAVARAAPGAPIDGFTVQPMIKRPGAHELILGAIEDRTFGPALLFGQGGVATEIVADRAMGLPPLNSVLAKAMVGRTRVARLLGGYRDRKPAHMGALIDALTALSDLVVDFAEIKELDINPLLADAEGVIALDARIIVGAAEDGPARLAIRPYPRELERAIEVEGVRYRLRPIKPQDADALRAMAGRLDADGLRLRLHDAPGAIGGSVAARLSQIDYDREMALVALDDKGGIAGMTRLVFDPSFDAAECALFARADARGLARALLKNVLAYAETRGARQVWGQALSGDADILATLKALGAVCTPAPGELGLVRAEFTL